MSNNINLLANQFGFTPALIFSPLMGGGFNPLSLSMLRGAGEMFGEISDFLNRFAANADANSSCCGPLPPLSSPSFDDSSHPSGSLQVDGDVITTPGGYKIEMTGKQEWKITGPDGKSTRIWGDPHVEEGDGGKWDFKRNSTFVLPDGTRINVNTVPGGKDGMTVTGSLEVISGNERVQVSDIDKGKGKIGTVTQDGYQQANGFDGDVFVMGQETDDWAYTGKEITGSKEGGESFELGGELHPLNDQTAGRNNPYADSNNPFVALLGDLMNQWQDSWRPNRLGSNPYGGNDRCGWEDETARPYDRREHMNLLSDAFRAASDMFSAYARFLSLSDQLSAGRNRSMLAV
jgi:hypothetical protein